jgi:hypothetical protein
MNPQKRFGLFDNNLSFYLPFSKQKLQKTIIIIIIKIKIKIKKQLLSPCRHIIVLFHEKKKIPKALSNVPKRRYPYHIYFSISTPCKMQPSRQTPPPG